MKKIACSFLLMSSLYAADLQDAQVNRRIFEALSATIQTMRQGYAASRLEKTRADTHLAINEHFDLKNCVEEACLTDADRQALSDRIEEDKENLQDACAQLHNAFLSFRKQYISPEKVAAIFLGYYHEGKARPTTAESARQLLTKKNYGDGLMVQTLRVGLRCLEGKPCQPISYPLVNLREATDALPVQPLTQKTSQKTRQETPWREKELWQALKQMKSISSGRQIYAKVKGLADDDQSLLALVTGVAGDVSVSKKEMDLLDKLSRHLKNTLGLMALEMHTSSPEDVVPLPVSELQTASEREKRSASVKPDLGTPRHAFKQPPKQRWKRQQGEKS